MKIVIDECLPKRLTRFFPEHDVWTVPQLGLAGYADSKLLDELDRRDIDIFITIDSNIEYQQQFTNRSFGTIIIRSVSNRYRDLEHLKPNILQVIQKIKPKLIVHIS